ncbi:MAG: ribosomal RNA small subunit methyltransferase A [Phycisphaeraceae bacterium]|nr:ribosomal RNA small subunit methyltransferase A [Phycisphaeraceae bacterium]
MQTLTRIKELLDSRGLRPKRSLGQNFLTDHNLLRKLADAADLAPGQLVVEVGPGTGTLTEELLDRGCEVIVCELDDALADLLRETLPARLPPGETHRFRLIHADCLADKHTLAPALLSAIAERPFKLVANLPYGAATPLIAALLTDHPHCGLMAVTIQKELGDRLTAGPGSRDYGPLAVLAALSANVSRVALAPPGCFWPQPDVTSVLMLITRRPDAPARAELRRVSALARRLMTNRRKQLGSAIGPGLNWSALNALAGCESVRPTDRAETLTPEQFRTLATLIE